MGLRCDPPKTFEIEEDGDPGIPREAVPSGVGGAGLEGAACMRLVKVETVSVNNCLIVISNAFWEFVIICCTSCLSNGATDDIAAWRLCAGGGESGLWSEERICCSISSSSTFCCSSLLS